jgi:type II secretory pathway component PulJ
MAGMGQHDIHSAAGRPLRRAHRAAWFTFIFMAGTTMTFQTYHSVEAGQMPWPLAVLFGVAAFTLAITVLEFARHSPSKWVQGGAYALTAGAMYMSASATGDVVLHAAPPHASLLFGLLMDGAAILAISFIFNGPTAKQAVAEVARREAELTGAVTATRNDLERAVAGHRKALAEAEAGRESEGERLRKLLADAGAAAEAQIAEAGRVHRMTVAVLEERERAALAEAEAASVRAERLERKLAAATGSGKAGSGTRKPDAATGPARPEALAVNPDDLPGNWDELDTEARVLSLVNEKGYSASKAGLAAGVTDARGRQIVRMARDLDVTAPQEVVSETRDAE